MNADTSRLSGSKLPANGSRGRKSQSSNRLVRLADLQKLRKCKKVAAVCYRVHGNEIQFLLVRTRNGKRWTFPKGSIEPGLTHAQAAALEAFEEAGVHGRIEESSFTQYISRSSTNSLKPSKKSRQEQFAMNVHLCEVLRLTKPKEPNRHRTWFSLAEATRRLQIGRDLSDGRAFARLLESAVARIERICRKTEPVIARTSDHWAQQSTEKDALQKIQFEAAYRMRVPVLAKGVTRLSAMERSQTFDRTPAKKLLPAGVLQFTSPVVNQNSNERRTNWNPAKAKNISSKNS
jgi:8-oxo-dGTP pyrophosphatase MutT (NUDIX family)